MGRQTTSRPPDGAVDALLGPFLTTTATVGTDLGENPASLPPKPGDDARSLANTITTCRGFSLSPETPPKGCFSGVWVVRRAASSTTSGSSNAAKSALLGQRFAVFAAIEPQAPILEHERPCYGRTATYGEWRSRAHEHRPSSISRAVLGGGAPRRDGRRGYGLVNSVDFGVTAVVQLSRDYGGSDRGTPIISAFAAETIHGLPRMWNDVAQIDAVAEKMARVEAHRATVGANVVE